MDIAALIKFAAILGLLSIYVFVGSFLTILLFMFLLRKR